MKILSRFSVILIMLIGISFSGCSWCETVIYVDRPKPYAVPVPCVIPNTDCNEFKYKGDSIEEDLGMCIHELKAKADICRGKDGR